MSRRYICDGKNEYFKKWREDFDVFKKEADAEMGFLKKRAESIEKRRMNLWNDLFEKLQADGLIPENYIREETGMHISSEHDQLFIDKRSESGPLDLLKALLER